MFIYIILAFAITIISLFPYIKHNSRQSKKVFLFLSFFLMTLVLGLRGRTVGEDTGHYLNMFTHASNVTWTEMLHGTGMRTAYFTDQFGFTDTVENGFLAIAKIIHIFSSNGQVFLFAVSAVTCILFAKFIYDNCDKVIFPTFIVLYESLFMLSFNGIRQLLAVSIVIQAYSLLKKKSVKKAVIVVLIATLIHNVSLVGFMLFPIMLVKQKGEYKSFKYAIVATVFAPIVVMMGQSIIVRFFPRYTSYFSTNYWGGSLGGTTLLWIVELVLVFICYKNKFKYDESFYLSCFVLIYLACELMGLRVTMFSRVGWFFRPFLVLFFPNCRNYFSRKNWRIIQGVIFVMIFLLFLSYANTPSRDYIFFWQ